MKKYYWLIAGAVVGIYTVLTAWWNMNILVGSGDLTLSGALIVTAEYAVVVYGLSLVEKNLSKNKKRK